MNIFQIQKGHFFGGISDGNSMCQEFYYSNAGRSPWSTGIPCLISGLSKIQPSECHFRPMEFGASQLLGCTWAFGNIVMDSCNSPQQEFLIHNLPGIANRSITLCRGSERKHI
eukprot:TRINITY_DN15531_c0_g1_i1.p1 TRINITY_DN15531_c0_g1~~TRINITY_DN15531_c0_g1_i1.p1  ORF type:complete len:113 (+),score=9.58 TRINITY_DN15531_c0_g1_i1:426-764(+)